MYIREMSRYVPFSEQLRRIVRECEETRYRISQETGIGEAALSKFVHGERGLSLESLDKLAALLRLEVVRASDHRGK